MATSSTLRASIALAVAIGLAASVVGCQLVGVRGEGPVTSETRQTSPFTRVDVNNGIGLTVRIGPAQPIEVHAQANILPIIASEIDGETLRIHSTGGYEAPEGIEVVVVTPALDAITISGGSQAQVDGLAAARLGIEVRGGGGLTATGAVDAVVLTMSGGSRATLGGLTAKTISVDLSGGSTADVLASDEVSGSASGGARLTVKGDGLLDVDSTGGAQVTTG
jgi:hypothetical protein